MRLSIAVSLALLWPVAVPLASPLVSPGADAAAPPAESACVAVGHWLDPASLHPIPAAGLLSRAARGQVVLLGERHDEAEHHRWQLHVIAALHALRPDMAIGLEMLPRRAQPVLDRWVRGELDTAGLLRESDWREVWGFDAGMYLPIFHFARMHRVPMRALNVDRDLTRRVARQGWAGVPADEREGVGDPAPATPPYLDLLSGTWAEHGPDADTGDATDDPAFARFVDAQLLWDRAMAEALASTHREDGRLVVGVMGAGHVERGHGVPRQLADLGIAASTSLLPWDTGRSCAELDDGLADAVFGVAPPAEPRDDGRPVLGVGISPGEGGVRVDSVGAGSVAESAGLRPGDVLVSAAGIPTGGPADLRDVLARQAPGTWLPIEVRRDGATVGLVAKFPAR